MTEQGRPRTLEGDWDRFYLEFPDVYDQFALTSVHAVDALHTMFDLDGKTIVDVGSGTGRSTFELAKYGRFVVGVEPWAPMRGVAVEKARRLHVPNVDFVDSTAEELPFRDKSVDHVVSVYGFPFWFVVAGQEGQALAERFLIDAIRTVKANGYVAVVGSAPSWEAGELTPIVLPGTDGAARVDRLMTRTLGFAYRDVLVEANYGTVQEATETYGFIFGQRAIAHLIANRQSVIRWKLRIHYRKVEGD